MNFNVAFYKEMKAKNLLSKPEIGIIPFEKSIIQLEKEATALYTPVLDRRQKASNIRVTLSILEQWKFFFNLANSLSEQISKGYYESAVRDYKKGKHLMTSSFRDDLEQLVDKNEKDMLTLPKNYQNVFEKLWNAVEFVVEDFRKLLFKSLSTINDINENQEKFIGYLLELDSKVDPIRFYLDGQYNHVLEHLSNNYIKSVDKIESISD
jgi:exocyst complex component 2